MESSPAAGAGVGLGVGVGLAEGVGVGIGDAAGVGQVQPVPQPPAMVAFFGAGGMEVCSAGSKLYPPKSRSLSEKKASPAGSSRCQMT